MNDQIKIDLPKRLERRFTLPNPEDFLEICSNYLEKKKFSDNEYVRTIYFNNDDHIVPFEVSIKAREYLKNQQDSQTIDDNIYFLDFKKGYGNNKEKVRLEMRLEEATKIVNQKFNFLNAPVRPYVLVEYLRQHYIPKICPNIRLTIDSDLRYFYLPENKKTFVYLGKEDYSRLEIKEGISNKKFGDWISNVIIDLNLFPIISKKFKAYNLLCSYHVKNSGKPLYKELEDCEIESKLDTESEDIFQEIKKFFVNKSEFRLPLHFPYTFESASINRYYRNFDSLFKMKLSGDKAEIVRKDDGEVINDKFGLDCILKRKEIKGEIIKINSVLVSSSKLEGELYRMRKAFWVKNQKSNRIYHISLDCCLGLPGELYQVEVEYTGKYGKKNEKSDVKEEEIIDDIAKITKSLIDKFPSLKPSTKTKKRWLIQD